MADFYPLSFTWPGRGAPVAVIRAAQTCSAGGARAALRVPARLGSGAARV